jgi:hypothetical protein
MSFPRQELQAFSRKERSLEQAVRMLLEANSWYVPAVYAVSRMGRTSFTHRALYPVNQSEMVPGRMVFFTDYLATAHADLPFVMVGELAGVDVFDALDAATGIERLDINFGLPKDQTFYLGKDAFGLVQLWSKSIRLEQQLSAGGEPPVAALRTHPGYLVAVHAESRDWHCEGESAVAFTAPDRWAAYLTQAGNAEIATVTVSGEVLFSSLMDSGLKGLVLNSGGAAPVTIPSAWFPAIANASPV